MDDQEKSQSAAASIQSNGDVNVGGDVAGRDKVINNTTNNYYADDSKAEPERRLRLTVHVAVFLGGQTLYYFVNATNLSDREIEITHIWFNCDPPKNILEFDRPMPKRLQPDETWETWIEVYKIPDSCGDPYTLARAKLSTGVIVNSVKNENVPSQGFVPGGPIQGRIGASSAT